MSTIPSIPDRHPLVLRRPKLSAAHRHDIWRGTRIQLLIEIRRTARMIDQALENLGVNTQLPESERRALEYLDRSSRAPCISDVGRHLRISRQGAQRLVIRLQRRGLVRFVYYDDRRAIQLRITAHGSGTLRLAGSKVIGLLHGITHGMANETLENTTAFLRTLQNHIRNPRYEE